MVLSKSDVKLGYCTNVHAGVDLPAIRDNLDRYAVKVRETLSHGEPLGLGLWLPNQAAMELSRSGVGEFRDWLTQRHLNVFTINGFPFDNFHQDVVKHAVYKPTWWQPERLAYTQCLADVLAGLLPDDETVGSISTLPIGWPTTAPVDPNEIASAGAAMREMAKYLEQLEARTGKRIVLAIEPEPGCILDTLEDCQGWFAVHLPEPMHRRYITVCHDVCHSAVMMEPQRTVIDQLAKSGIGIGKVQASSAIVADWSTMSNPRRREALNQLAAFAEDRYLHQTGRWTESGSFELEEDLPQLLARLAIAQGASDPESDPVQGDEKWVIHFHVPIFLERFGHLATSHSQIMECLRTLLSDSASSSPVDFTGHIEVETYAWTVLPESMRRRGLAEDIAAEMNWIRRAVAEV